MKRSVSWVWLAVLLGLASGCKSGRDDDKPKEQPKPAPATPAEPVEPEPPPGAPMQMPVPLWENGKTEREVDAATAALHGYVVLDLGEPWVPYLFTDGVTEDDKPLPNSYRTTYLALARGELPNDIH